MSSNEVRLHVLRMYKNLLRICKDLPKDKKYSTINQIRNEFIRNKNESNAKINESLLTKAASSLGYLKMITPKTSMKGQGVTSIIFSSDGSSKTPVIKAVSNWHGKNMDPDAVKRHYDGLKRAGFKNNSHVKGPLF